MPLYDGVLSDCVILNDIVRLKELEIVFEKNCVCLNKPVKTGQNVKTAPLLSKFSNYIHMGASQTAIVKGKSNSNEIVIRDVGH